MFWQESRVKYLEAQVKDLTERLRKVEAEVAPFRVGNFPTWYLPSMCYGADPRPTVTHSDAINLLMRHVGVEFKKIPGTPEQIVLEKKPKTERST
jgi:hypothetical protein